jgi:serine O-acetyltransferase
MTVLGILENQLRAALFDCCDPDFASVVLLRTQWEALVDTLAEDVLAFADKDPSAHSDPVFVLKSYTSFKAVLHHRLAHEILMAPYPDAYDEQKSLFAAIIAGRGKMLSGAEIHPRAKIGRRFVLDHGFGTVIGETTEIGDDCYVLGSVTLGACGIAANPHGRRHPVIGDRVQIGAFARVFGRVNIGDDVFIGPHCVIKDDVPSQAAVTVRTEHQIVRRRTGVCEPRQPVRTVAGRSGPAAHSFSSQVSPTRFCP